MGYPANAPKNAPAWYMETMFADIVANFAALSFSSPNSSLNEARDMLVPMNAD